MRTCEIAILLLDHDEFKMIPLAERRHLDVTRGILQDMPVRTGTSLETISAETGVASGKAGRTASKSEDSECLTASLASGRWITQISCAIRCSLGDECRRGLRFFFGQARDLSERLSAVTTTERFEDLLKNPAIDMQPTEKIKVYNKGITLNGSSEDASQLRIGYRG